MSSYVPPSVIVNGTPIMGGSTATVNPATVALIVNMGSVYPTATVTVPYSQMSGSNAYTLPTGTVQSTITATDLTSNTVLTIGTQLGMNGTSIYTIPTSSYTGPGPIKITYQWADQQMMTPMAWQSSAAVEAYFGQAFTTNGAINNPISAGAVYAFGAGCTTVITLPYWSGATSNAPVPISGTINWVTSFSQALQMIMQRSDVDTIVPIMVGNTEITNAIPTLLAPGGDEVQERMICALDATSNGGWSTNAWSPVATANLLTSMSSSANSPQVMLIGNSYATSTAGAQLPPSMYACAVAGVAQTTAFNQTMTHLVVPGFALDRNMTTSQMNSLAQSGITVITALNGENRIRQALCTVQNQSLDWDYGAVFNYITSQLKVLFDPYIGKPQTGSVLNSATGALTGFLEELENNNIIAGYQNVSVTYSTTQAGTMVVTFEAAWLSPINYILVNFTFNTTSGSAANYVQSSSTASAASISEVKVSAPVAPKTSTALVHTETEK